jgi:hypothetical protein
MMLLLVQASTVFAGEKVEVTLNADLNFTELDDTILYPDPGWNVIPIIEDGILVGWEVVGRQARGTVSGTVGTDDITGSFTFTYSATLDLNQQGPLEGMLVIDTEGGIIKGQIEGGTLMVGGDFEPGTGGYLLMVFFTTKLKLEGTTTAYQEIEGEGDMSNWDSPIKVVLDGEGHVIDVIGGTHLQAECLAKLE